VPATPAPPVDVLPTTPPALTTQPRMAPQLPRAACSSRPATAPCSKTDARAWWAIW
jgi:hypothetical protein